MNKGVDLSLNTATPMAEQDGLYRIPVDLNARFISVEINNLKNN